jgi:hypothetical protein
LPSIPYGDSAGQMYYRRKNKMGKTKTSGFSVAVFDKPPYYEHEVIANLEELSLTSSQSAGELNKNFQNISTILDKASANIANSIADEAEKSRIQSAIENEKIVNEISETNYRLLDVANGIEGLSEIVRDSSEEIVEVVYASSNEIVKRMDFSNHQLAQVNFKLKMVNESLNGIAGQLGELLKKITKPNETEALELADQARINLALNKKEVALKVTRNALEISNGTSITVLAYHILTLSLFDDENSKKEIIKLYEEYVNLVKFKLTDKQSDREIVIEELDNTLYLVMSTMGYCANHSVMLLTQDFYRFLYNYIEYVMKLDAEEYSTSKESVVSLIDEKGVENILKKPLLHNATRKLIAYPNHLRELHWSVLLNEYVVQKRSLNDYIRYISALAKSEVLIKNELMVLAIKHFNTEGFLYAAVVEALRDEEDEILHDAVRATLFMLPQDMIEIDHRTYWVMKLYAMRYGMDVNALLDDKFTKASEYVNADIKESYIDFFDNAQQEMHVKESEMLPQIEATEKEHIEMSEKKMEEWRKHNKTIDNQGYENKIKNLNNAIISYKRIDKENIIDICVSSGVLYILYISFINPGLPNIYSEGDTLSWGATLIVGTPASAIIGYFVGGVLVIIIDIVKEANHSSNKSKVKQYQAKLAKKYNLTKEKEKIDTLYNEKISNLSKRLMDFQTEQREKLELKFNALVDRYMPSNIEPSAESYEETRAHIGNGVLGEVILSKRPEELKFEKFSIKEIVQNPST